MVKGSGMKINLTEVEKEIEAQKRIYSSDPSLMEDADVIPIATIFFFPVSSRRVKLTLT